MLGKPPQAKLRINEPGDEYEQEADSVAEQVMRMGDSTVQADSTKAKKRNAKESKRTARL